MCVNVQAPIHTHMYRYMYAAWVTTGTLIWNVYRSCLGSHNIHFSHVHESIEIIFWRKMYVATRWAIVVLFISFFLYLFTVIFRRVEEMKWKVIKSIIFGRQKLAKSSSYNHEQNSLLLVSVEYYQLYVFIVLIHSSAKNNLEQQTPLEKQILKIQLPGSHKP